MYYNRTLLKAVRLLFSFISKLDQADYAILRIIPANTKRRLARAIYKPLTSRLSAIVQFNGLSFYIPRNLDYSYITQEHEPQTQQILKTCLKPGMYVIDAGANIGYLTLLMAQIVGKTGKVYAIEPGIDNLQMLHKNVQLNGITNVEVLPVAAGAIQQQRQLYLGKAGTLHSLHSRSKNVTETQSVEVVSLDEVIPDRIDFVKMDVEGAEIEALKGMTRIFQSNPDIRLLVEWNPLALDRAGYDPADLPEFLWAAGFELSVMDDKRSSRSIEEMIEELRAKHLTTPWHVNLYAKRSSSPTEPEFSSNGNSVK